jgi:hypothetical protein
MARPSWIDPDAAATSDFELDFRSHMATSGDLSSLRRYLFVSGCQFISSVIGATALSSAASHEPRRAKQDELNGDIAKRREMPPPTLCPAGRPADVTADRRLRRY